jgi:hypothetical protein
MTCKSKVDQLTTQVSSLEGLLRQVLEKQQQQQQLPISATNPTLPPPQPQPPHPVPTAEQDAMATSHRPPISEGME